MRTLRIFTHLSIIFVLFAMLSLQTAPLTLAETNTITIGPWTFGNDAFADIATDESSGLKGFRAGGDGLSQACQDDPTTPACLDEALTGYSYNTFLVNIGNVGQNHYSNKFQLDFTDLKAENNSGADIVFFYCHFEDNSYEFSVHPEGGPFTSFVKYDASLSKATSLNCNAPTKIWGVEIDISTFGLAEGTVVDAIQFKALNGPNGYPEGEPSMAAVLPNLKFNLFLPSIFR
jgi:hypothetical protein